MHLHLHIAARKGDSWKSLYTGTDEIEYARLLEKVQGDTSFDEIKPFPFAQPGLSIFPKLAAQALTVARAQAAREAEANAGQLAEEAAQARRKSELYQAQHAEKILLATPADDKEAQEKLQAALQAARANLAAVTARHAAEDEKKTLTAKLASLQVAAEKNAADIQSTTAALEKL